MSVHPIDAHPNFLNAKVRELQAQVAVLEAEAEALFLAGRELERENERLRKMLADLARGTKEIADANRLRHMVSVTGLEPDAGLPYASIGTGDLPSEEEL